MIDFYGSEPQFVAQLASTFLALPAEWRGWFGVTGGAAAMRARELGVEPVEGAPSGTNPIVVASYGDLKRARAGARPVIYSEHGAGQQYPSSGFSNYIGGQDRAGVVACLVPGSIAAAAHRRSYPSLPVYEIGVPRLDRVQARAGSRVPGVAFHWNGRVPETRTAFPYYTRALARLPGRFGRVVGHSHPKIIARHAPQYARWGFDVLWRAEDVFETVGVLAVDNSSVMWEAALLGIPVVVLNCPSYRRDVEHGMRFWEFADIGPQVDVPNDLEDRIEEALQDTPERARYRAEVASLIYAEPPGRASEVAAETLVEIAESIGSRPEDGAGRSMRVMARTEWRRPVPNPYAPKRVRPRSEVLAERRAAAEAAREAQAGPTTLETGPATAFGPVDDSNGEPWPTGPEQAAEPTEPEPEPSIEVPTGKVDEIVDWIGDDPARAQAALDVEMQSAKPRKGVREAVEQVLDAHNEPVSPDPEPS